MEAGLDEEIAYTKELLQVLDEGIESCGNQKIEKISKKMKELLENEQIREIRSKDDKDARFAQSRFKRFICYASSNVFYGICSKCKTNSKIRGIGYGVNHSVFL